MKKLMLIVLAGGALLLFGFLGRTLIWPQTRLGGDWVVTEGATKGPVKISWHNRKLRLYGREEVVFGVESVDRDSDGFTRIVLKLRPRGWAADPSAYRKDVGYHNTFTLLDENRVEWERPENVPTIVILERQ